MQQTDEHEVVLVNDGSTDSTLEILERHCNKIRIVNQKNRGLSAARNTGLPIRLASMWLSSMLTTYGC